MVRHSRRKSTPMRLDDFYRCRDGDDSESDEEMEDADKQEGRDEDGSWELDASDEEQLREEDEELNQHFAEKIGLQNSAKVSSWPKPPVPLAEEKKAAALFKITSFKNAALQKLLFDEGFQFELFTHQFEAARRVAGVPDAFPCHYGSPIQAPPCLHDHQWRMQYSKDVPDSKAFTKVTMKHAIKGLDWPQNQPCDKGFCLADAMGLGKTIEAIAGAVLRNSISKSCKKNPKPTLIVSPNDAVQNQWRDALVANGIALADIVLFQKRMPGHCFLDQRKFVLLTRYTALAEFKDLAINTGRQLSALFPKTPKGFVDVMYAVKEKSPARTKWTPRDEKPEDTITRFAKEFAHVRKQNAFVFGLFLIDEAHFLKNRLTYASMACVLAGANAERSVPLTGTPYNNALSDLATLMSFVEPQSDMASTRWWHEKKELQVIKNEAQMWTRRYVLRRDKEAMADELPEKKVSSRYRVETTLAQLDIVYAPVEDELMDALGCVAQLQNDPYADPKEAELWRRVMLSKATCARMATVHPLLLGSGREVTRLFSPSRSGGLVSEKDCPRRCVCCVQNMRPSKVLNKGYKSSHGTATIGMSEAHVDNMEVDQEYDDDIDEGFGPEEHQENLLPLPACLCTASKYGATHYAHAHCLAKLQRTGKGCPRCKDLRKRRTLSSTGPTCPSQQRWCRNVVPSMPSGFVSSPKIDEGIKFIMQKKTDKVIITSFFKASLDLFEGILVHDMGFKVARFDGDLNSKQKEAELQRFRKTQSCRFLLMTVQSGGVGLNLTEARRMLVLDHWYNPFVHEQMEDRIYRIGQTKNVEIRNLVTAGTIDEAMREINLSKKQNSRTLLDSIDDDDTKKKYQEMAGMMGRLMQAIRGNREELESKIKNDPTGALKREIAKVPRLYAHQVMKEKSKLQSPLPSAAKKSPKRKKHTPWTARKKSLSHPVNQYSYDYTDYHSSPPVRQPLQHKYHR